MRFINYIFTSFLFLSLISCAQPKSTFNETTNSFLVDIDTTWKNQFLKSDSYWKEQLTNKQFNILREKGTEHPFTSPLLKNKEKGIYTCVACANPLFSSNTKFKSGTGWPSFWQPFFNKSVLVGADNSHGMQRDEVVCAKCNGHLGHVFNDGPKPTGLRYCINGEVLNFKPTPKLTKAVFAQGCFWCVEEIFESLKGVKEVYSGYSGGEKENPTYKEVGSGYTKHAEAVQVIYDASEISYQNLLKVYFNSGDITQVNGQGNDIGKQYRSVVFYNSLEQKKQIESYKKKLIDSGKYKNIAVEVKKEVPFYLAEKYHQDYVKLNPNQSYVRAVSIPRYKKAIKNFPELLK